MASISGSSEGIELSNLSRVPASAPENSLNVSPANSAAARSINLLLDNSPNVNLSNRAATRSINLLPDPLLVTTPDLISADGAGAGESPCSWRTANSPETPAQLGSRTVSLFEAPLSESSQPASAPTQAPVSATDSPQATAPVQVSAPATDSPQATAPVQVSAPATDLPQAPAQLRLRSVRGLTVDVGEGNSHASAPLPADRAKAAACPLSLPITTQPTASAPTQAPAPRRDWKGIAAEVGLAATATAAFTYCSAWTAAVAPAVLLVADKYVELHTKPEPSTIPERMVSDLAKAFNKGKKAAMPVVNKVTRFVGTGTVQTLVACGAAGANLYMNTAKTAIIGAGVLARRYMTPANQVEPLFTRDLPVSPPPKTNPTIPPQASADAAVDSQASTPTHIDFKPEDFTIDRVMHLPQDYHQIKLAKAPLSIEAAADPIYAAAVQTMANIKPYLDALPSAMTHKIGRQENLFSLLGAAGLAEKLQSMNPRTVSDDKLKALQVIAELYDREREEGRFSSDDLKQFHEALKVLTKGGIKELELEPSEQQYLIVLSVLLELNAIFRGPPQISAQSVNELKEALRAYHKMVYTQDSEADVNDCLNDPYWIMMLCGDCLGVPTSLDRDDVDVRPQTVLFKEIVETGALIDPVRPISKRKKRSELPQEMSRVSLAAAQRKVDEIKPKGLVQTGPAAPLQKEIFLTNRTELKLVAVFAKHPKARAAKARVQKPSKVSMGAAGSVHVPVSHTWWECNKKTWEIDGPKIPSDSESQMTKQIAVFTRD